MESIPALPGGRPSLLAFRCVRFESSRCLDLCDIYISYTVGMNFLLFIQPSIELPSEKNIFITWVFFVQRADDRLTWKIDCFKICQFWEGEFKASNVTI